MVGFLKMLLLGSLAVLITGCGGSSSNPPQDSTVTVTFNGATPAVVATRIGNGSFARASLTGNILSLALPSGFSNYTVAYVCPPPGPGFFSQSVSESVIEASIQDGSTFSADCSSVGFEQTGAATGVVDASAVSGATQVLISGRGGLPLLAPSTGVSTSFKVNLLTGTQDIAFLAVDAAGRVLAVKVLRSQSVPGPLNGGATILFGPSDAATMQSFTLTNLPAGFFNSPSVEYQTANNTVFSLTPQTVFPLASQAVNGTSSYSIVPPVAAQSGDVYLFSGIASNLPPSPFFPSSSLVQVEQRTTSGGGPVTLAYPAPLLFAGPVPAAFPTFTFNYSGFPAGLSTVAQEAGVSWSTSTTFFPSTSAISIIATPNFQNGSNTITIPDLTSISGFLAPPASGTTVRWHVLINGSTAQEFSLFAAPPANVSTAEVQTSGSYTEP